MTTNASTSGSALPETVTVHVPFRLMKRGGRKEIHLPPGTTVRRVPDSALVKALARAFRWKRLLDNGEFSTIADLASHEKIALSYLTRVLRLTLLAPDIVEAVLDGQQGSKITLAKLLEGFPDDWDQQRAKMQG